jgi:hypothetical protein
MSYGIIFFALLIERSKIYTVLVESQVGEAWYSSGGQSGPHQLPKYDRSLDNAVPWNAYFLPLDKPDSRGFNAILFIRTLTASSPYR